MDRNETRAWLMLDDVLAGRTTQEVADGWRVSRRTVQVEVARVRRQLEACDRRRRPILPPKLVPIFPVGPLTPHTRCRHAVTPIRSGSVFYCPICDRSGQDAHPYFADASGLRTDRGGQRKAG